MYNSEQSSGGRFTAGLIIGAAAGVGLALLFAPKAGRELRDAAAQRWRAMRGNDLDDDAENDSALEDHGIYGTGHSRHDAIADSGRHIPEHTKPLGGNHSVPVARSRT